MLKPLCYFNTDIILTLTKYYPSFHLSLRVTSSSLLLCFLEMEERKAFTAKYVF